jgi:hypothetical protein
MEDKGISPWRWFFGVPVGEKDRGVLPTILWWEFRRPICNILVFALWWPASWYGFYLACLRSGPPPEEGDQLEYTLFQILVPMVLFNICYTAGCIAEGLLGTTYGPERHQLLREALLKLGLGVSFALISLYLLLSLYLWMKGEPFLKLW